MEQAKKLRATMMDGVTYAERRPRWLTGGTMEDHEEDEK
jgi:hypothetical protein